MRNCDTDIVSVLCLEIAQQVGESRYELYFSDVTIEVGNQDSIVVNCPNRFYCDWLRTKFGKEIEQASHGVRGAAVRVEYRIAATDKQSTESSDGTPSNSAPDAGLVGKGSVAANTTAESRVGEAKSDASFGTSGDAGATDQNRFKRRKFASLQSFVAGQSNRIAFESVRSVIRDPGRMSPLFIYGPTGVGKSHLLEGLWHEFRRMPDRPRCLYVSAEQFTSTFLDSLHGRGMPRFRRRFRDVDLLVVEDVQFFAGKAATISELQYTIEAMQREGRQLAFSSDRSPARLDKLGADLVNRFCGGLVLSVDAPDLDTRIRILEHGATLRGLDLSQSIVRMIADRLANDVRKLHGALNRLQIFAQTHDCPITLELTVDALAELFRGELRSVNLVDIEKAVCDVFGVDARNLKSTSKVRNITQARQLAMWLARKHTRAGLLEIGEHFGRRSHSTVISAEKKVNGWRTDGTVLRVTDRDCSINEAIERVQRKLRVG